MRELYQAANTLEAHMIVGMLREEGIDAEIEGEYLQGGAGELQAMGVVKVLVEERFYESAKAIVDEWDAAQPASTLEEPQPTSTMNSVTIAVVLGFLLGVILTVRVFAG